MGDLDDDTRIEHLSGHRYRAAVSEDWNLWGPVGGYVASLALRAAGAHTGMSRPASLSCHYLAPARFEAVDIEVRSMRMSRRAESLSVLITQAEMPILQALVWTVAAHVAGPEDELSPVPRVPPPERLDEFAFDRDVAVSNAAGTAAATATLWKNLELRKVPVEPRDHQCGTTEVHTWERFRPRSCFVDPWLDACREVISIDTAIFPAVATVLGERRFVAPSMDLNVAFHAPPPADEYLLVTGRGTAARDGLLCGTAEVRTPTGVLTASGGSQLLCSRVER